DAHVTTLLTAIILFYFGLGPVKGFATTQILGILLSLFCGILVSRWITEWFTNKKKHLIYFTGISRRIFKHAKFKFIEYRKVAYIISAFVIVGGVAALFNGFDEGVEFKGGRSYRIAFEKPVENIDQLRDDLRDAFDGENPVVKTVGGNSTLDITTSYQINNTSKTADSTVQHTLMNGLKNYLPQGITYADFNSKYKQSSDKVLPTISDDLRKGAVKATI
ncbi:MAG TPA: protein translocase subunit SecDF, partial [Chitinophagaceae bacterium]|nr:protein translocase subunit SecDF [Chitinophagaceae bacterium]